jgi:hypothetical protein
VYAYCDAVDRIDGTGDLGQKEWQQIEVARGEAERARFALLQQRRKPVFTRGRNSIIEEAADQEMEELVLGDVGQLGG